MQLYVTCACIVVCVGAAYFASLERAVHSGLARVSRVKSRLLKKIDTLLFRFFVRTGGQLP